MKAHTTTTTLPPEGEFIYCWFNHMYASIVCNYSCKVCNASKVCNREQLNRCIGSRNNPYKRPLAFLTLARKPCFATFAGVGGGLVGETPLGVSKRSVVELRGKDQQIALAEYSRLVVLFLVLGQYLTQL